MDYQIITDMILDSHIYSHYDDLILRQMNIFRFKLLINDTDGEVEGLIMFLEITSKSKHAEPELINN